MVEQRVTINIFDDSRILLRLVTTADQIFLSQFRTCKINNDEMAKCKLFLIWYADDKLNNAMHDQLQLISELN